MIVVECLKTFEEAICLSKYYVMIISRALDQVIKYIDDKYIDVKPSTLIFGSIVYLCVGFFLVVHTIPLFRSINKKNVLKFVRGLPIVRTIVEKKLAKIKAEMKHELVSVYQNEVFVSSLPKRPINTELLLKKMKHYQMFDTSSWQNGRISGAIYTNNNPRLNEIILSAYGSNMWSNPLHSDVFAGVRRMEAEIIRMIATMYNGDPEKIIGSMTSGGTESILMACKAYRDFAIKVKKIDGRPEIVCPVTAHAAFEKSANLLNCKIVHVPVNKNTLKVDMKLMRKAINRRTCMLVGSAPQFPHGIIDPIKAIGKLGLTHRIPVHVDACLGGFLIPFMKGAGHELDEDFDFSVPGVTSISCDTHKYGYAPKGTSTIIYSDKKFIHQQYSVHTDWPGGIYASPTLPGSRPGALIATCWASMMFHGLEGYVDATDKIIKTTRWIRGEIKDVKGLEVLGDPRVSVIAFTSHHFDIYELNSRLKDLGWNLNPLQFPSAFHICITLMHTNNLVAASFVKDVKAITKQLMQEPKGGKKSASAAIYGMASTVPDRSLVGELCTNYLDGCLGY